MMGNGQKSGRTVILARFVCIGIGLFLAIWAFFDNPIIGGGEGFGFGQVAILAFGVITVIIGSLPVRIIMSYLLLLVSSVTTLVLAEIVLRNFLGPYYYTAYSFDPKYLFKLEPGASRAYVHQPTNGGHTVVYRINSDGFRGPDLRVAEEKPRILVYGDSFIHAEFSELEETLPVQLANLLSDTHVAEVEVINAGVAGYGPDQILMRMETELARVKPDLVLVSLFSGNDFGDLLRNRLYRLSKDGQIVENDFHISTARQRKIDLNRSEPILRRMLKKTLSKIRKSEQEAFVFDKQKYIENALALHLAEYEAYIVNGNNTVGEFEVDPYSADIALLPGSPSAVYKIRLMSLVVERMKQVAAAHSVPLVVVIIPHPMDLLGGDHSSGWVDKTKYPDYRPSRLSDTMVSIAEAQAVPYLNLFPVFQDEDVNSMFLRGGDDHWNGAGQKLAAEAIADFLAGGGYQEVLVKSDTR